MQARSSPSPTLVPATIAAPISDWIRYNTPIVGPLQNKENHRQQSISPTLSSSETDQTKPPTPTKSTTSQVQPVPMPFPTMTSEETETFRSKITSNNNNRSNSNSPDTDTDVHARSNSFSSSSVHTGHQGAATATVAQERSNDAIQPLDSTMKQVICPTGPSTNIFGPTAVSSQMRFRRTNGPVVPYDTEALIEIPLPPPYVTDENWNVDELSSTSNNNSKFATTTNSFPLLKHRSKPEDTSFSSVSSAEMRDDQWDGTIARKDCLNPVAWTLLNKGEDDAENVSEFLEGWFQQNGDADSIMTATHYPSRRPSPAVLCIDPPVHDALARPRPMRPPSHVPLSFLLH